MSRVLVVDDDGAIRVVIAQALRRAGHEVTVVASLADLDRALSGAVPDVLVSDVVLPDGDGLDHVARLAVDHPSLPIIILSARNTLTTAVRAREVGAFDYLPKPFDLDLLVRAVEAAAGRGGNGSEVGRIEPEDTPPLIGRSPAMQEVYRVIARVVATDLTVLISGESGTGKELVARAIHDLGARGTGPFVAINMAAIPRDLIEAELFGHERGAFTGAAARVVGRFEQATAGTLFLDEIGDMPLEAQTRLLRVLQSGEFTPVGGARAIRANARILAATNQDLAGLVRQGRFREDLFYRLHVVPLAMPSLRERRGDIGSLARHFLDQAAAQGLPRRTLDARAMELLEQHDWPGNVRELENVMRRLCVLSRDEVLSAHDLAAVLGEPQDSQPWPAPSLVDAVQAFLDRLVAENPGALDDGSLHDRLIAEVERPLIKAVLARHGGNQVRAARALGLNRNTLRKRLDTLGLDARPDEAATG